MYLFNHRITWSSFYSFTRQVAAVVGLAVGVAGTFHLPEQIRQDLVLGSSAILTAEHYAARQAGSSTPVVDPTSLSLNVSSQKGQS